MSDTIAGTRIRGGYHLSALRVDLSTGAVERAPISEEFALGHIGGPGFGAALLAENAMVFAPGPLTGLALPGAARCHIVARSPGTGRMGGGSVGGRLGPAIRRAGYDAVVIAGRATELSYVAIDEDSVEIVRAPSLAGTSAQVATGMIRDGIGRDDVAVAAIGPAGEEQSSAAIISSGGHHCAGGSMGAVMGSRNLKAVVVSGRRKLPVADPARLAAIAKQLPARARCPADCEDGCVLKRSAAAVSPELARTYDELGVDVKAAGGAARRRPVTPEGLLLDLLGLCYQPWLDIDRGVEMAVECYGAVTGVERGVEELLERAEKTSRVRG